MGVKKVIIITCCGYYGTGSSAVTDFFSEFSNCESVGNYEFRFIHDPNGIRDLEYNLIENNNRHNTSHAIKNYKKFAKHLNGGIFRKGYRRYVGDNFKKYTDIYIDNITELICDSWWHYDVIQKGAFFYMMDITYQKVYKKLTGYPQHSLLPKVREKGYFSAISKEDFYIYTKEYVKNVISCMSNNNSDYVMVDQLLPPSNINQYINYFDDIKVVVVDRDPRDCYLLDACRWQTGITPCKNIEEFCKWFEIIRRNAGKNDPSNSVIRIQFEDMIFKYDEMRRLLADFVGIPIENHVSPKSRFDPHISIANVNLIKQYPKYEKEIKYIEEHLSSYLYDFEHHNL